MVLFPKGGLGRLLLVIIIITTISYLVINMVSFGGNRWITYVNVPVRIGLWRVCDTTAPGRCNSWASQFVSNITNFTFNSSKPAFIRSSQALEIIALIFYIFAAGLILLGILDLPIFPYQVAFLGAAGLLFISIIFISATLGLMSDQGRDNHQWAFLDWAWWNGLAGLLITILCFVSLLSLVAYLKISSSSTGRPPKLPKPPKPPKPPKLRANRGFMGGGMKSPSYYPPMVMAGNAPPILPPPLPVNTPIHHQPYNDYLLANQYFPENYSNQFFQDPMMAYGGQGPTMPYGGQGPPMPYGGQGPPMPYGGQGPPMPYGGQGPPMPYGGENPFMSHAGHNSFMPYGGENPFQQYSYDQSPSPLVSELARQYFLKMGDAQYERQLLEPYEQYLRDPYLINNYL